MAWSYRTTTLLLALAISTVTTGAEAAVVQQKLFGLSSGLAYFIQVNIGQPLYSASTANTAVRPAILMSYMHACLQACGWTWNGI